MSALAVLADLLRLGTPRNILVDLIRSQAAYGDYDAVSEIIVYGDRALQNGCEDPTLVTELVATANRRLRELEATGQIPVSASPDLDR